jgi:hypothetical protein
MGPQYYLRLPWRRKLSRFPKNRVLKYINNFRRWTKSKKEIMTVSYTSWSKPYSVQLYTNTVWMCHILYRGPVREHVNYVYYKSYWVLLPVYTVATFSFSPIYLMLQIIFCFVTIDIFKDSAFEAELLMYPSWMLNKKQDESRFVAFFCVEVLNECSRRDGLSCWPSEMQPLGICLLACRTSCLIWSFVVFWLHSMKFA